MAFSDLERQTSTSARNARKHSISVLASPRTTCSQRHSTMWSHAWSEYFVPQQLWCKGSHDIVITQPSTSLFFSCTMCLSIWFQRGWSDIEVLQRWDGRSQQRCCHGWGTRGGPIDVGKLAGWLSFVGTTHRLQLGHLFPRGYCCS